MTRVSKSQLAAECRVAAFKYPIGSEWRHYKGDVYEIVGFGVSEKTGEIEVEYKDAEPLRTGDRLIPVSLLDRGPDLDGLNYHRSLKEWDELILVSRGELLPPGLLKRMSPEEKLEAANECIQTRRFTRVYRDEQWNDHL